MLKINGISKEYNGTRLLEDINFNVEKGEVVSIIGPSGCGKSTLLKCINRLEEVDGGKIYFNNCDITKMDLVKLRQKIGIVFQEYNLFEHLTVVENLMLGLTKIKGFSEERAKKEAIEILKKVELEEKINHYPDELSGGERQRVAILRTIIMRPQIILLDEATSALDKEMKKEVLKLIQDMVKEDMTLIIVSHEEDFIHKISDKIIVIKDGKSKLLKTKIRKGGK